MSISQVNFRGIDQNSCEVNTQQKNTRIKEDKIPADSFIKNLGMKQTSPVKLGNFGFQKFTETFSDEQIAEMNQTRKLPEGYYLKFTPKTNHYVNGCYNGTTPARYDLVKLGETSKKMLDLQQVKYTNKIPNFYEIDNKGNKTYLKEKNVNLDDAMKKSKVIGVGLGAVLAILGVVALKDTSFAKNLISKLTKTLK